MEIDLDFREIVKISHKIQITNRKISIVYQHPENKEVSHRK